MTNTGLHPLAADYLNRLQAATNSLPADVAEELMTDLREHLDVALPPDASEIEVRTALDRLGSPAEVVAAASPSGQAAPQSRATVNWQETSAVIALVAAEVIAFLIPLSIPIWLVGVVLLALSKVWSGREKLRGFLALATGFPLVLITLVLSLMTGSTTSCVATSATNASEVTSTLEPVCTTTGTPTWISYLLLAAMAAYLIYQIMTARALLNRRA
jgi:hypothetical protein